MGQWLDLPTCGVLQQVTAIQVGRVFAAMVEIAEPRLRAQT